MSKLKNVLAATAVASLALSQPAAAATRSVNSLPQASYKVDRIGSAKKSSDEFAGLSTAAAAMVVAAIVAIIIGIIIVADDEDTDSPG